VRHNKFNFFTLGPAGIAGVFLYVALVSMMSELGESSGEHDACAVLVNIGAMTAGACLLLLVGLYEDDIIAVFE
jgi:zinc transporter ZupT